MTQITLDTLTIAASVLLIVMSVLAAISSPFFRFKKRDNYGPEAAEDAPLQLPALSIVLTPFDDIDGIRKHLPLLLRQDYPSPFQIIIVLEQGDHDGEAVVAHYEQEYRQQHPDSTASVYVTYIPNSSRYVSRKKVAITLGSKAAKTDWGVLTESYCMPSSDRWLDAMARRMTPDNHLVMGYGNYTDDAPAAWRFEKLYNGCYLMREVSRGRSYRDVAHNLAFRKEDFMNNGGFQGNLEQTRGEYDFLVNKFATMGGVALVTDNGGWMLEEDATPKRHINDCLYYLEISKSLERGTVHRALYCLDQLLLHLALLLSLAGVAYGAISHNVVVLAAAILSLLLHLTVRILLARKALRSFDEHISPLAALFHEIAQVWRTMYYRIRLRMADRLDFTTHKL